MLNRCRMIKKLKKESNQNLGNKKRFKSKWKERQNSLNLMKNKKGKRLKELVSLPIWGKMSRENDYLTN